MRIVGSVGMVMATLLDLVALKGGLIITEDDARRLLQVAHKREGTDESDHWTLRDLREGIRIRAEELEFDFLLLLRELGVIDDTKSPDELVVERLLDKTDDSMEAKLAAGLEASTILSSILNGEQPAGFEDVASEVRRRFILDRTSPEHREWDGAISLNDLFESEHIPAASIPGQHFDQRFIDYLAAQSEEIERIHWRQFEYLCGEYFQRNGYTIDITPPRGDGGIDVYATKSRGGTLGPELIVIQARRRSDEHGPQVVRYKLGFPQKNGHLVKQLSPFSRTLQD